MHREPFYEEWGVGGDEGGEGLRHDWRKDPFAAACGYNCAHAGEGAGRGPGGPPYETGAVCYSEICL
jgi:hypothetical protein